MFLSWARAVLEAEGLETVVLDAHVSAVEGSIGAIPRRLMVPEADAARARDILSQAEAGLAAGAPGDGA